MKIGIFLWGIIHGRYNNDDNVLLKKDFSHCWPNLREMLVQPLFEQGHSVDIFLSTYTSQDRAAHAQILKEISPKAIIYSNHAGSNRSTCKLKSFELMPYCDSDIVILCRSDMHLSKKIPNENVDYSKFNFLFPEVGGIWWDIMRFTTDNFYMWPNRMTKDVEQAMIASLRFRPERFDTHALYPQLALRIASSDIHFVSNTPEGSDVNSFYTLCRKELPNSQYIHPEVRARFGYEV